MSPRREKPDADGIRALIRELPERLFLGPAHRRWPLFVWHYSDIRNIANILRCGRIYSRQRIKQMQAESVEIARLAIIDSSPWAHPYARLYFRPATPTQHNIEGIRVNAGTAHCPVPVFLLFDSESLLTREGCMFSDTNLARHEAEAGDTLDFMLRRLNFHHIFHDRALKEGADKHQIIGARCAEVLFRDELDLEDLREVVCRTPGERETLLHLLGDAAERWRPVVRVVDPGERMFFRDHAYVQQARLLDSGVLVDFGGVVSPTHTYTAGLRYAEDQRVDYEGDLIATRMLFRTPTPQERVGVHLEICGCLAYRNVLTRGGLLG